MISGGLKKTSSAQLRSAAHSSARSAAYVALAQQRSTVQYRSLACPGVPCRAVRYCCAMLCGVVVRTVIPPVLLLYAPGTIC